MKSLAKHRGIFTGIVLLFILTLSTVVIFYSRGFKPNFKKGSIDRTGLIVATSVPTGAQVYLDGRLTSATNTNIAYLEPRTYKIRIEKDGYTTWEKDVDIKEDLATEINALLFPLAPEIKPLTTTGAISPAISPDGAKIAYSASGERGGLYVLPIADNPFTFRQNTKLVAKNTANTDYTKARFIWSADSKEIIARFEDTSGVVSANLLVDSDKTDQQPRDITGSLAATIANWQQQIEEKAQSQIAFVPDAVKDSTAEAKLINGKLQPSPKPSPSPSPKSKTVNNQPASPAKRGELSTIDQLNYYPTGLIFSPDEEKILFVNKEGKYNVYDLKLKKLFTLPDFADLLNISWFWDGNHLVIAQPDKISIIEADGNNNMAVFSGKFEQGFVFSHPSASRLVILTSLTQLEGSQANLYTINLK